MRNYHIRAFPPGDAWPDRLLFHGDFLNVPGALAAYRAGNWVKVPFLVGSNTDEGRSFAPSGANTEADIKARIATIVPPDQMDPLLELYPDVPAAGCPFNTGDFQLDPSKTACLRRLERKTSGAQPLWAIWL
ncbi:hypothetical protein B0H14DRAFT_3176515 [Mycena olivaceomarginata]|nr:hypothetical protein B0H14DRAFT_3176515 [Mycena olivaceomarginata]